MKSNLFRVTLQQLYTLFTTNKINTNPAYQRDYVADTLKDWRENFIASIFKGNRIIPNIYAKCEDLEVATDESSRFQPITDKGLLSLSEIIDGQQRLKTIVAFLDDEFRLNNCVVIDYEKQTEYDISGMNWTEVVANFDNLEDYFLNYELNVAATYTDNLTEIFEMFFALNNLNQMTAQEKRNSIDTCIAGYVRNTARLNDNWKTNHYPIHDLFVRNQKSLKSEYTNLTFKKMAQDEMLAKLVSLVNGVGFEKGVGANVLDNLYKNKMYKNTFSLDKKVNKLLDKLYIMLQDKQYKKKINLGVILNLSIITLYLQNEKSIRVKNWHQVMDWFMSTHQRLSIVSEKQRLLGIEETNYHQKTRLASDSKGLEIRRQYLLNELDSCKGLVGVDTERVLNDKDFFELWLKADDGKGNKVCQTDDCSKTLRFDEAIKGHIKAHSEGGKTTPENTIVVCSECNKPRD